MTMPLPETARASGAELESIRRIAELEAEVERLNRVNLALMNRVERSMDLHGSAFALFQTASLLEQQVRERTAALETALHDIERSNRDIQSAKQLVETAQSRLNDALEAISDGFVLCDPQDRIALFNSKFGEMWSGVADLLRPGVPFATLISSAAARGLVRNGTEARRWLARRSGRPQRRSSEVLELTNGVWLRISERQTRDGGWVGIYSDITAIKALERRRRQRELAAKSVVLQATLDNLSQGVSVFDGNLELVAWNHRLADLLGLRDRQLRSGTSLLEFLQLPVVRCQFGDPETEPRALWHRLKTTRAFRPVAVEWEGPGGAVLEVRTNPMPGGGFVTTYTDITARRLSDAALRDSERRMRLITDAMPALIAYVDTEERYRFTNMAYEAWFRRPRSEINGRRMKDVLPSAQYEIRKPHIERVLRGQACEFEIVYALPSGDRAYAHATYVPHLAPEGGAVLGFFALIQDVTERNRTAAQLEDANRTLERRVAERTRELTTVNAQLIQEIAERNAAEQALRHAKAEAERANLSKTKFLAAASHDLLQPLNAARVFVAALSERRLGARNLALVNNLTLSLEAVDELLGTLLDLSKLDAGVIATQVTDFRLDALLQHLEAEFQPMARERGLGLRVRSSDVVVRSDQPLLGRILRNFLTNALRYTPSGRILLACRRGATGVRICVWDTGVGIPEEKLGEIFQEFWRLRGAGGRDRGAGLGLAIVDRIARRLNHPILVRSTFGRGSMFGVEVPYGDRAALEAPCAAAPLLPGAVRGARVVVVDNEPAILTSMATLLEGWGCSVLTAETPEEAADRIDPARAVDLVVADHHLYDGKTGLDAIHAVRTRCGHYVPALVISADRSEELQAALKAEGIQFLPKPVKPARLRSVFAHLLARRAV